MGISLASVQKGIYVTRFMKIMFHEHHVSGLRVDAALLLVSRGNCFDPFDQVTWWVHVSDVFLFS